MERGPNQNRKALLERGIVTPEDLALWARKRGMLSVYIQWLPARGAYPSHWQVVRPGYKTDPKAPAWQRGNKTWICDSLKEKNQAEENARYWASAHFDVDGWVRIEGLGGALFPDLVARELRSHIPELWVMAKRQRHTYHKTLRP